VRADIADVRAVMHATSPTPTDGCDNVCPDEHDVMMSTPTDRSSPMPSPSTRLCEPAPLPAPPTQWPSIPPPRNESEAAQIVQRVEQESESRQRLRSHRAAHTTHYPTVSPTEAGRSFGYLGIGRCQ
jgi:hypothetical protein